MKSSVHLFLNNFAIILRQSREKQNYSQLELANKIAISLRTYQRIENGESEPSLSQVYKLARILNFNVGEIFHFEENLSEELILLHQASHELKLLAKLSRIGSWQLDSATGLCKWSDIIREILEVENDFIPTLEAIWPFFKAGASLELGKKALEDCLLHGRPFQINVELITAKGNTRHCIVTGLPETIEGNVVNAYGVFQDNTSSHLDHLKLQSVMHEIAQIQSLAGFGYWKLDIKKNNLHWSDSLYALFEVEKSAIMTYDSFLELVHPEDRSLLHTKYNDSLVTKEPYEIEHRILLSDGRIKWIQEKCSTVFDESGHAIHSIGYTLDVTKYKIHVPNLA